MNLLDNDLNVGQSKKDLLELEYMNLSYIQASGF